MQSTNNASHTLLPADLRDIKLWITECGESFLAPGTPPDRSPERYFVRLSSLQKSLQNSPGDPDEAGWTVGNGGSDYWNPDRLEGVLGVIEQVARAG